MSESPGVHVTSLELELDDSELEDATVSLELDSTTLLELGALISDELLVSASDELFASASEELLCSNSPQPSGGQYTPYRGCASSS
jgi:hypothetical protein